jgi:hypothetical protein
MLDQISDADVWHTLPVEWLWIYDKLIVAQQQGVLSGPAGVSVPTSDHYIIRPITNIRMMSRGAKKLFINPDEQELVPDGYFWSEILTGRHISVDYHWGQQELTVEGFRDSDRLDRFCLWRKVNDRMPLPLMLQGLDKRSEWINVEYIGNTAIEVHLRYNDDFRNHSSNEIIPVWQDSEQDCPTGYSWYASAYGDRLGFWTKNDN